MTCDICPIRQMGNLSWRKNLLIALKFLFWQTMTWYGIRLWISSIFGLFQSFSLFEFCQTLTQYEMKFQIYLLLYSPQLSLLLCILANCVCNQVAKEQNKKLKHYKQASLLFWSTMFIEQNMLSILTFLFLFLVKQQKPIKIVWLDCYFHFIIYFPSSQSLWITQ